MFDASGQQQEAERRREGQRDEQRGKDGEHVGESEGSEEGPRQSLEEEDRQEDQHHDQRAVDDRAPHLERGGEDDLEGGAWAAAARFWRSRRSMFSTSMIASSTTSPSAITSPARTMVLSVPPR